MYKNVSFQIFLRTKSIFDSLTIGTSEYRIKMSTVDPAASLIITTCWRVRSASAGISGQMLGVLFFTIIDSPGRQSIDN